MAGGATRLTAMADLRPRWRVRLAVFVLACVAITGCAAQATSPPSATPGGSGFANGCEFMTIDEAGQALGAPMDTATPLTDAVGCTYEIDGSPTVIAFQFTDQSHWTEAHTGTYTTIDLGEHALRIAQGRSLVEELAHLRRVEPPSPGDARICQNGEIGLDLGNEAIYTTDADTGFTVFNVRQGSTYLSIVVNVEPGGTKTAIDVGTAVVGYVLP